MRTRDVEARGRHRTSTFPTAPAGQFPSNWMPRKQALALSPPATGKEKGVSLREERPVPMPPDRGTVVEGKIVERVRCAKAGRP